MSGDSRKGLRRRVRVEIDLGAFCQQLCAASGILNVDGLDMVTEPDLRDKPVPPFDEFCFYNIAVFQERSSPLKILRPIIPKRCQKRKDTL